MRPILLSEARALCGCSTEIKACQLRVRANGSRMTGCLGSIQLLHRARSVVFFLVLSSEMVHDDVSEVIMSLRILGFLLASVLAPNIHLDQFAAIICLT